MGNYDRYKRSREAKENAGAPLGEGLELEPAAGPTKGFASVAELRVDKPFEQGGRSGMRVSFALHLNQLGGEKLLVETTLHEQGVGPLKGSEPAFTDTIGHLSSFQLFTPADDEPTRTAFGFFFPFAAIEVDRAGTIKCFARVKVLEAERGTLAEDEVAFQIVAG